jgi:hypothetical protein
MALIAAGGALYEIVLNNFMVDRFDVDTEFRGFLELPRESQGFLVAFYVAILAMLSELRVYMVGAGLLAAGLILMTFSSQASHLDPWNGLGVFVLAVIVHSAGMHIEMVMRNCAVLHVGDISTAGRRIGQVGFWSTLAGVAGAAVVWSTSRYVPYETYFIAAAVLAVTATILVGRLARYAPTPPAREKWVFQRKFRLYYVLVALFGVRKQIFITFAPWVLIKSYGATPATFAQLWLIGHLLDLGFRPLVGRFIDRFGERTVLMADAAVLVVVCLGYGYAEHIFGHSAAIWVVQACFVLDRMIFFVGSARGIYVKRLSSTSEEATSTISLGMSIDHVFSMTVPMAGALLWEWYGFSSVFLMAAGLAATIFFASSRIRTRPDPPDGLLPHPKG